MAPELTGALAQPLDWSDSYDRYQKATVTRWRTTCLGGHQLGETCLHRLAENRWTPAECCEGCVRLLMDALTGVLPDLPWHPVWRRRAGQPEQSPAELAGPYPDGGGHRAG